MSLKLISLNIEGHKHLEARILPFLLREKADVLSFQEVFAVDVPRIESILGMRGRFVPVATIDHVNPHVSDPLGLWGVAQFTRCEVKNWQDEYYYRYGDAEIPQFLDNGNPNAMHRALMWGDFYKQNETYTIATTHFTWSTKGETSELQRETYQSLERILDRIPEIILSGDFNAPRGREIFQKLATRYTDNIPPEITTSIDGALHKAGPLELMVDGLFTTHRYHVESFRMVDRLSDHQALVAEISPR